jgi:2-polyprenyl-6-methoxyphenol hydroxylase-like FAD-dependent oxidoreductase
VALTAGLDVRVFEQRETFRGGAISIWPYGLNHLKSMDPSAYKLVAAAGATNQNDTVAMRAALPKNSIRLVRPCRYCSPRHRLQFNLNSVSA